MFDVTLKKEGRGAFRMELVGQLDYAGAMLLDARLVDLRQLRPRAVAVDLGSLTFLDSSGLLALMRAQRAAGEDGYEFSIHAASPQAQRVFGITGAGKFLNIDRDALAP